MAASEDTLSVVVRVQFNEEWIVRFQVCKYSPSPFLWVLDLRDFSQWNLNEDLKLNVNRSVHFESSAIL
jgi:hypothetical protein